MFRTDVSVEQFVTDPDWNRGGPALLSATFNAYVDFPMDSVIKPYVGVGLLMASAGAAAAADYRPVPEPPTAEAYAASGFYLRGDAGWSWLDWSAADSNANSVIAGGGVGYRGARCSAPMSGSTMASTMISDMATRRASAR